MSSRRNFLVALVVGSLFLPTAALSDSLPGEGNNNGNGNIGSGNGNCNSGNNNGNNNVGSNKGNGNTGNQNGNDAIATHDLRRKQMKQLQDQLKGIPIGLDLWKLLPDCLS
jgi:hypothetical protein